MIDSHTHFIPEQVQQWIEENKTLINAKWIKKNEQTTLLSINDKWAFPLNENFTRTQSFTAAYSSFRKALVSPVPQLFLYDQPVDVTSELVQVYNDALVHLKAKDATFEGLATLSLQSPEQAAKELEQAIQQGLKGAIVGPGFGERTLADSFFDPLFEAANATQAVLFVHPLLHSDPRLNHSKLPNLIGVPWETTIAAANLIVQGVLDRYPNITFLLAHGGGFLPYQIGRMSKGFRSWENEFAKLQRTPLEYATSFYYDSVLWDERTLDYLLEIAGKNQVIPGSDFPFELNDWKIDQHKLNHTPSFL